MKYILFFKSIDNMRSKKGKPLQRVASKLLGRGGFLKSEKGAGLEGSGPEEATG